MKPKTTRIILLLALVVVAILVIWRVSLPPYLRAQFLSGEDGWLCEDGEWVEHGHPSSPAPAVLCPGN